MREPDDWRLEEDGDALVLTIFRDWTHIPRARRRLLLNGYLFVSLFVAPFLYLTVLAPLSGWLSYGLPLDLGIEAVLCIGWCFLPLAVRFAPLGPVVWRFAPGGVLLGKRTFGPGRIVGLRLKHRRSTRKGSGPSDVADAIESESRWIEIRVMDRSRREVASRLFDCVPGEALQKAVDRINAHIAGKGDSPL